MSVAVELDRLRERVAQSGDAVFLLTVRDGSRPHAISTTTAWDADDLVVEVGAASRSAKNAADHPDVTLLWPSAGQEYSLIVDGRARLDGDRLRIEPTRAVRHRSVLASAPDGHEAGDDPRCIEL
jgi:hypothetical protein